MTAELVFYNDWKALRVAGVPASIPIAAFLVGREDTFSISLFFLEQEHRLKYTFD